MGNNINLVFIILNYKSYKDTIRVVNELLENTRTNYRIVVVDNASPNDSFEILSRHITDCRVDVISSPDNGGYAKGNNYGLRYAKRYNPEYACIINNDVHFTWKTIDHLIDFYRRLESPGFISPIQKNPDGSNANILPLELPDFVFDLKSYLFLWKNHFHRYESNTEFPNVQRVGYIHGAFLFVNYLVFESLGFFDECTFLFCEERFTGHSTMERGLNNYVILDAYYIHEHSKTIGPETSGWFQRKQMLKGRILYTKRYRKFASLKIMLLYLLFYYHEFVRWFYRSIFVTVQFGCTSKLD